MRILKGTLFLFCIQLLAAEPTIHLKPGDYLRNDLIYYFKKNHSTCVRKGDDNFGQRLSATVTLEGGCKHIIFGNYFHEVDMERTVNEDTGNSLRTDDPKIDPIHLKILSATKFKIVRPRNKGLTYRYVGSINELVNSFTICGKYTDADGRYYEFTKNGTAIFPDRTSHYEIGLDHVLDGPTCTEYILLDEVPFAYTFVNKQLSLYQFSKEEIPTPLKIPFLILIAENHLLQPK